MSEQGPSEGMHPQPQPRHDPTGQPTNEVIVDDTGALPTYSNFCRVMATPEEIILDFGLNPLAFTAGRQDVKATQRIVMDIFTTKRLLNAIVMTIQRHELTFGSIELDVGRRVIPPSTPPQALPTASEDHAS